MPRRVHRRGSTPISARSWRRSPEAGEYGLALTSNLRHDAKEPVVAANARLTGITGALLLVRPAAMGITVLWV